MMTIQTLKKHLSENADIYVTHFRNIGNRLFPMSNLRKEQLTSYIEPRGGAIRIKVVDGENVRYGYSYCKPMDNFSRKNGMDHAIVSLLRSAKSPLSLKMTKNRLKKVIPEEFHKMLE